MAFGYSMAGGGIGTAMVVPGPGLQNASAGIGTAYAASCPIMVVSGQIDRDLIGVHRGELHEVDDQLDVVRPVTKWASRVLVSRRCPRGRPRGLRSDENRAAAARRDRDSPRHARRSGRYGAQEPSIQTPLEPGRRTSERDSANPGRCAKTTDIRRGWRDLLGCVGGPAEARRAPSPAPVTTTNEGKGSISDRHYLSVGTPNYGRDPLDRLVDSRDVILAVGTRLARARSPRWHQDRAGRCRPRGDRAQPPQHFWNRVRETLDARWRSCTVL